MRLFTSTVCLEEFESRPPFLTDPTRDNLKNMSYSIYRDHKIRLPTPEKVAIMELSNSFERRRLGKQQQMLTDMSQRCREQEVADLSSKLSEKCSLLNSDNKKTKEVEFYRTNFMTKRLKTYHGFSDEENHDTCDSNSPIESSGQGTPKPVFDKSYKHFPARRVMKHQSRFELGRPKRYHAKTEKVSPQMAQSYPEQLFTRAKLLASQRINGQIQLDHYSSPRSDHFAPLILPSIDSGTNSKLDSITTARVNLGTRTKTTFQNGFEGNGSSRPSVSNKSSYKSTRSSRVPKTLNGNILSHINVPQTEDLVQTSPRPNSKEGEKEV